MLSLSPHGNSQAKCCSLPIILCTCKGDPSSPVRKTSFDQEESKEKLSNRRDTNVIANRTSRFGNVMNSILHSSHRNTVAGSRDASPSKLMMSTDLRSSDHLPAFGVPSTEAQLQNKFKRYETDFSKILNKQNEQEAEDSLTDEMSEDQQEETGQVVCSNYSLDEILNQNLKNMWDIKRIKEMLESRGRSNENPYKPFYPLVRIKGHLQKMHRTKLTKYPRFIYLNPIEGVLISYKTAQKFPHQPNIIIHLNQITQLEFMRETKWYFNRGQYYMKVVTPVKEQIFFEDNLDVINFWVRQIGKARKFYVWLQDLIKIRYSMRQSNCINNCQVPNCKCSVEMADSLINTVMKLQLPEVDMD